MSDCAIVLFAYNRPAPLRATIRSLRVALQSLHAVFPMHAQAPLVVAIDGPRRGLQASEVCDHIQQICHVELPNAKIKVQAINRGLPAHLIQTLDEVFSNGEISRAICIEDDIELSKTALTALVAASNRLTSVPSHVLGASPLQRDGSLEHQALLLSAGAHFASRMLLSDYVKRFGLDGTREEGAYGSRDHAAIAKWSSMLAQRANIGVPRGTSQDRIRELAWRLAGTQLYGLPVRLARHRGLWGQHNTPWYALRTGQLFQRLDRRPWEIIYPLICQSIQP